jgi:hypothetical protein
MSRAADDIDSDVKNTIAISGRLGRRIEPRFLSEVPTAPEVEPEERLLDGLHRIEEMRVYSAHTTRGAGHDQAN